MLKRFLSLGKVQVGLVILGVFVLVAIIGEPFSTLVLHLGPYDYDHSALGQPPSARHLLGTTSTGQDVLVWLLYGTRNSILVGLGSAVVGIACTVLVGLTGGFIGGWTDRVLNAVTLIFQNVPSFAVLFIVAGFLGNANWIMVSLIIGFFEWPGGARAVRAQAMSLRGRDFATALRTVGESRWRIVLSEVLPHLSGVVSPMFLRLIAAGIGQQAAIAFLGIGSATDPSWGLMISYATNQNALFNGLWWWFVPPGLCLALIGLSTTMLNFGLDEVSNPTLSTKRMRLMNAFLKSQARVRASQKTSARGEVAA
ncbi:MAG: ABC transporter permease [Microbacteriaceae bacterium]|nr:ABC transporter permease [Microbacteriaceae bacterium]